LRGPDRGPGRDDRRRGDRGVRPRDRASRRGRGRGPPRPSRTSRAPHRRAGDHPSISFRPGGQFFGSSQGAPANRIPLPDVTVNRPANWKAPAPSFPRYALEHHAPGRVMTTSRNTVSRHLGVCHLPTALAYSRQSSRQRPPDGPWQPDGKLIQSNEPFIAFVSEDLTGTPSLSKVFKR